MPGTMMLLVNPAAGRTTSKAVLGTVVETFCLGGWHPTVYFTTGPKTASELTRRYASAFDRLVCLGGDGTLSDVISGLMQLPPETRPPLGYIPMGTANDVASTLEIPRGRPLEAALDVLNGQQMPYDVGRMNGQDYFTYVAAFGAFTEVSYSTDQEMKNALGRAAYLLDGLTRLPKLKSYRVRIEHDSGVIDEDLLFGAVSNSTSVAGMIKLDKRVVALSDGKFELLVVRPPKTLADLRGIVNGLMYQDYTGTAMSIYQTSQAKFTFAEPVPWTRDGENGGEHRFVEIENFQRAVDLIR
ncbi:MAG: diacylglycerol kinase family lipid kinase [Ruminococcaceae bacterium]|nr:diacylglycerol kinase family lipid kinase [Oscillospiraceae bacterium]